MRPKGKEGGHSRIKSRDAKAGTGGPGPAAARRLGGKGGRGVASTTKTDAPSKGMDINNPCLAKDIGVLPDPHASWEGRGAALEG